MSQIKIVYLKIGPSWYSFPKVMERKPKLNFPSPLSMFQ